MSREQTSNQRSAGEPACVAAATSADADSSKMSLLPIHTVNLGDEFVEDCTTRTDTERQMLILRKIRFIVLQIASCESDAAEIELLNVEKLNAIEHELTIALGRERRQEFSCSYKVAVNNHMRMLRDENHRHRLELMIDEPVNDGVAPASFVAVLAHRCRASPSLRDYVVGDESWESFVRLTQNFKPDSSYYDLLGTFSDSYIDAILRSDLASLTKQMSLSPIEIVVCFALICHDRQHLSSTERAECLLAAETIVANVKSQARTRASFYFGSFVAQLKKLDDADVNDLSRYARSRRGAEFISIEARLLCLMNLTILFAGGRSFVFDIARRSAECTNGVILRTFVYSAHKERAAIMGVTDACLFALSCIGEGVKKMLSMKAVALLMLIVQRLGKISLQACRVEYDEFLALSLGAECTSFPKYDRRFIWHKNPNVFSSAKAPIFRLVKCLHEAVIFDRSPKQFVDMLLRRLLKLPQYKNDYHACFSVVHRFETMVSDALRAIVSRKRYKRLATIAIIAEFYCRTFYPTFCNTYLKSTAVMQYAIFLARQALAKANRSKTVLRVPINRQKFPPYVRRRRRRRRCNNGVRNDETYVETEDVTIL